MILAILTVLFISGSVGVGVILYRLAKNAKEYSAESNPEVPVQVTATHLITHDASDEATPWRVRDGANLQLVGKHATADDARNQIVAVGGTMRLDRTVGKASESLIR